MEDTTDRHHQRLDQANVTYTNGSDGTQRSTEQETEMHGTRNSNVSNLAAVVLHECSSDVKLMCGSRVFSSHLEHGTSCFDPLGTPSKPHVLDVRLSAHIGSIGFCLTD